MNKPYINLDTDFPGIVSLFMYDREVVSRLTAMGQTIEFDTEEGTATVVPL